MSSRILVAAIVILGGVGGSSDPPLPGVPNDLDGETLKTFRIFDSAHFIEAELASARAKRSCPEGARLETVSASPAGSHQWEQDDSGTTAFAKALRTPWRRFRRPGAILSAASSS